MAEVKWIKIVTDIFDDEKIIFIEQLPDSYAIITAWFKLLCLAGKQNNSGVFMLGRIPYTDKMLATIFRMKESTVTRSLQTFEQLGMIEIINGVITIPNWNKHQTLDSYEKRKERDRIYSRDRRAAQKALIEKSTDQSTDASADASADPSPSVGVSDKERRLRIKIYNILSGKPDAAASETAEKSPEKTEDETDLSPLYYQSIIDRLNEKAGTHYRWQSDTTQKHIHKRLTEGFKLEDFFAVIDHKCAEWKNDAKMREYLRPMTLFGTKFESYLQSARAFAAAPEQSSFDTEDFFTAALQNSYGGPP